MFCLNSIENKISCTNIFVDEKVFSMVVHFFIQIHGELQQQNFNHQKTTQILRDV